MVPFMVLLMTQVEFSCALDGGHDDLSFNKYIYFNIYIKLQGSEENCHCALHPETHINKFHVPVILPGCSFYYSSNSPVILCAPYTSELECSIIA